jgi:hypothetical protein
MVASGVVSEKGYSTTNVDACLMEVRYGTAGLAYDYADQCYTFTSSSHIRIHIIRAGLNYRFGYSPVVAIF